MSAYGIIDNAKAKLRKAIGTRGDTARMAQDLMMPVNQVVAFLDGVEPRALWGDNAQTVMDRMASFIFAGLKRYDFEHDVLVSTNDADPLPQAVGMDQHVMAKLIAKSRADQGNVITWASKTDA